MKVLVCGGRNFHDDYFLYQQMDKLNRIKPITLVIQGGARGADTLAKLWAVDTGIPYKTYKANWDTYGNRAGPIRNQQMLDEGKPDLVVGFDGGRGTRDMMSRAAEQGFQTLWLSTSKQPEQLP